MTGTPSQLRVEINEHSVSLTIVADKHTHAMTYSDAITFARADCSTTSKQRQEAAAQMWS